MPVLMKPSFSKGEISPELHGRVDTTVYDTGLATARNAIVHTYGGVSRRPGTQYLAPVKNMTQTPRLVKFQFSREQQYVLEIGNQYMRVMRDDGHILHNPSTINQLVLSGGTDILVVCTAAHGLVTGDEVFLTGLTDEGEPLNGHRFIVELSTASSFWITSVWDSGATRVSYGATAQLPAVGTVYQIYETSAPWALADLFELTFSQSADVLTVCHKDYAIYEIARVADDNWTITKINVDTNVSAPSALTTTVLTAGTDTVRYTVTAIGSDNQEESLPGVGSSAGGGITGITQANPGVVTTSAAHGLVSGDEVRLAQVVGMTDVNQERYIVTNPTATTFELYYSDGTAASTAGFSAYSSGGVVRPTFTETATSDNTVYDNRVGWVKSIGADRYRVYRLVNGLYQFIGETQSGNFTDAIAITPDPTISPPVKKRVLKGVSDRPAAVGYYQQRRVFGGTYNNPDTSYFSQTGRINNFNTSFPLQDDDAITATLTSLEVNEIRHYLPLDDLLVFTSGSEWAIQGGRDSAFTPDTINQRPQTNWGSSYRQPIVLGSSVLFVTPDLSNVRSFGYSFDIDGYSGENLNITARHLLNRSLASDWCHTVVPDTRVYIVMSDGKVNTMSYDKEQEVVGWTWWDTDGQFKACCSLNGGGSNNEDSVYFVVRREIDGNVVRMIEVWRQEYYGNSNEGRFVDCYTRVVGEEIVISGAVDNGAGNPRITTSSSHGLTTGDTVRIEDITWEVVADDFGNETQPDVLNGNNYSISVNSATEFTLVGGEDISDYTYVSGGIARVSTDTFTGLFYLEGEELDVHGDGEIRTGLDNTSGDVEDGEFFVPFASTGLSIACMGLPYFTDIETLDISVFAPNQTVQAQPKRVNKVTLRLYNSKGAYFLGPNKYDMVKQVEAEWDQYTSTSSSTALITGDREMIIPPQWGRGGRVFIRVVDPLPFTLLGVVPNIER